MSKKWRRRILGFSAYIGGGCIGWFGVGLILAPSIVELCGFIFGLFTVSVAILMERHDISHERAEQVVDGILERQLIGNN